MSADLKVSGFPEAIRLLKRLERIGGKRALGKGLADGARVARKEIKRDAPKRIGGGLKRLRSSRITRNALGRRRRVARLSVRVRAPGYLKRNIRMKRFRPRNGVLRYRVAPVATAFYARFVHQGEGNVRRPNPFLARAVRRSIQAIQNAMVATASDELAKIGRSG